MDFGKALEAMKADKKVRLPELPQGWYIVIGDVAWGGMIMYRTFMLVKGDVNNYEGLKLIPRILLSNEWEIIEDVQSIKDIQTVEIKTTVSEIYTCPKCGQIDDYYPSCKDKEWFVCGRCGAKLKAVMQTDKEVLDYLRVELDRNFERDNYSQTDKCLVCGGSLSPHDLVYDKLCSTKCRDAYHETK